MRLAALMLLELLSLPWADCLKCYECNGDTCKPSQCDTNENRCMTFREDVGLPTGGCTTASHCSVIKEKYENQSTCCDTDYCNKQE